MRNNTPKNKYKIKYKLSIHFFRYSKLPVGHIKANTTNKIKLKKQIYCIKFFIFYNI